VYFVFRKLLCATALPACMLALSACGTKGGDNASAPTSAADQSEMQKYNAYVEAANTANTSFAEIGATYQRDIKPKLDSGKNLDTLFFPSDPGIDRIKEQLDKALALSPAMPAIDGAARSYSAALAKIAPLYRDMENYVDAKRYMGDKGAHGREVQPALLAALGEVATAQAAYAKAIDAADRARVKAAFEATEKGTLDHYRKGSVYYLKESMDHAAGVIDGKGLGDQKAAFAASLDQFNTMAVQFDTKVREKDKTACASFMLHANAYLAAGRDILQRTDDGTYAKDRNGSSFQMIKPKAVQDAETLLQAYNNVINDLNVHHC